jgi:hypothetical protein
MENAMMLALVLGMLAMKGIAILALAYIGARLAVRHELRGGRS